MNCKVFFKIGDHVSKESVNFNTGAGPQGSVAMPLLWLFYIFQLLDAFERDQSNLIKLDPVLNGGNSFYSGHVSYADDVNANK